MFLIKFSRSCFLLLLFFFFSIHSDAVSAEFSARSLAAAGLKHLRELSQHGIFAAYHGRGVIRNKVSRKSVCQFNLDRIYTRLNPIFWNRKAGVQSIFIWKRQKNWETGKIQARSSNFHAFMLYCLFEKINKNNFIYLYLQLFWSTSTFYVTYKSLYDLKERKVMAKIFCFHQITKRKSYECILCSLYKMTIKMLTKYIETTHPGNSN